MSSWLAALGVLFAACCTPSSAAETQGHPQLLSQMGHSTWRTQEGAFTSPNGIAQTNDGYLWLATNSGLMRFDGVRFVARNDFPEGSIADWRVTSVLASSDGSLWIGSTNRIGRLRNGHLTIHAVPGTARQFVEDAGGTVWFVRDNSSSIDGAVCNVTDQRVQCHASDLPPYANALEGSEASGFWIGSSIALCHWFPGHSADCLLKEVLKPLAGLDGVTAVLTARDGTFWVGMAKAGDGFGLGQMSAGQWKTFDAPGFKGSELAVSALLEDSSGSLWIGTSTQGVYRLRAGRVEHFGAESGLTGNTVSARGLIQDREGTVWVATSAGLDAFRDLPVTVISTREGLPADSVESILPARDGTVWVGNLELSTLIDDRPSSPPMADFVRGKSVTSFLEDSDGRIWVGLENALYLFEKNTLRAITRPDGSPLGVVERLAEDASHDVWARTVERPPTLFRIRNLAVVEELGQALDHPFALIPDRRAGMWFTYNDGSIGRFEGGVLRKIPADAVSSARANDGIAGPRDFMLFATNAGLLLQSDTARLALTAERGMPCDRLNAIVRDARGNYWITASCGLIGLTNAELERWMAQPSSRIQTRFLAVTDGFQPGRGAFVPAAKVGPDGRLWFANGKIAEVVDPEAVTVRSAPPPVLIEELVADRVAYPVDASIRLPPRSRNIDIRFTALSFVVPHKIRFQYRLVGRDPDWREAVSIRQAFYTDLPPGHYRFDVRASNSDGVWNDTGASMAIEIQPVFYQTRWFMFLVVIGACAALYGLYLVRLRAVAARLRDRLAAKHNERERIARDLHDTLLQGAQALIISVDATANEPDIGESARLKLKQAVARAAAVLTEGRDRIQDLRVASAGDDLHSSLRMAGEQLACDYGSTFSAQSEGSTRQLTTVVREEAYQIGREALTNAFKHANAGSVALRIFYEQDDFRLLIRDDGKGFDLALPREGERSKHWGLQGMRERAAAIGARFEIRSRVDTGTEVELRVDASRAYDDRTWRDRWRRFRRRRDQP